jgi:PIN domain nuclease of toxin-antitoxin system
MNDVVLDSSALLALLKEEPGGAQVAEIIATARINAVNLAEVVSHFVYAGMPASEVEAMLRPLPLTVIAADAELARLAGRLRAITAVAGLSLGDRFCLAQALRDGLPAWTADRNWLVVESKIDAVIVLIR